MTAIPPTAFSTTAIDRRPTREAPAVVTATVAAAGDISANLRRLTLHCPDFTALTLTGPDEFFGVLMPRPGDGYTPIPAYTGGNIRAHVGAIPERFRPDLRWYTIRHFDQRSGTLEFNVVTHGVTADSLSRDEAHVGPGLRWALTVRPGETVGVVTGHGLWRNDRRRQLLIGDAAAAPSIWSILDFQRAFNPAGLADMHVIIAVEGPADVEPGRLGDGARGGDGAWADALGGYHVITGSADQQTAAVDAYLRSARAAHAALSAPEYVWVCGEQTLATTIRAQVVREWGMNGKDVFFSPYWIAGRPRP